MLPFQLLLAALGGWLDREQAAVIAFLREENRVLKARLGGKRLRFQDGERRRLAELGQRLRRRVLVQIATLVTPDTILRWHRELVARKWTYRAGRGCRAGLQEHLRALVIRIATENPTWGYTRIQGALKNVGHRVGRSTIARIPRAAGIPPGRQRPTTWRTFLQAHWPALVAADFFTTEVWTARGLVRRYVAFLLHVPSRRIQVIGCTPHPNEARLSSSAYARPPATQAYCARVDCCCAIATQSGAVPLSGGSARPVCTSCERRHVRRTVMRTRSGSSDRSRKNVSIVSFRSASGTCAQPCGSSPRTITENGIIRGWRMN